MIFEIYFRTNQTKQITEAEKTLTFICQYWTWTSEIREAELLKLGSRKWDQAFINMRVWSWLRMNAGGVPNTCKSNGVKGNFRMDLNLVADGWVTRG